MAPDGLTVTIVAGAAPDASNALTQLSGASKLACATAIRKTTTEGNTKADDATTAARATTEKPRFNEALAEVKARIGDVQTTSAKIAIACKPTPAPVPSPPRQYMVARAESTAAPKANSENTMTAAVKPPNMAILFRCMLSRPTDQALSCVARAADGC